MISSPTFSTPNFPQTTSLEEKLEQNGVLFSIIYFKMNLINYDAVML